MISQLAAEMSFHHEKLQQLQLRLHELEKKGPVTNELPVIGTTGHSPGDAKFSWDEKLSVENFIGLRLMHLVGIVVLVIGISIGVKYAVDRELISEIARIALAYATGIILYVLSARLKKKFALFSAILFSGAMASLYFTSYAAFVYYQLFSFPVAFILMVAITIFTAWSAIRYNRQEIAVLGMIGAYGIPFLISANADKVHLFFAYILLINAGIVFLSFKKNWKAMVTVGILVSWTLYIGWALLRFTPPQETAAVLFLAAFYLLFSVASLAFPLFRRQPLQGLEVQHFVYNNVFAFASALIIFTNNQFDERSTGITGAGFFFFSFLTLLIKFLLPNEKLLFKYLAAMSVLCLVFYVGMKWDGVTVTMIWLLIAAGLFTAGVLSKMAWLRLLSILLTAATLIKLVIIDRSHFTTVQKIISYIAIGVLLLVLSFFYQKFRAVLTNDNQS